MSTYKWLCDSGHGGLYKGKYVTAPSKMHIFQDGLTVYEGVINRIIADKLAELLKGAGIDYRLIHDGENDDSLAVRVSRADAEYMKDKRCIFLGIHSNAGGGRGFEIFTSRGQNKSDKIAGIFCEVYRNHFPDFHFREEQVDGDADKEADFYVLRKTDCPALLVENLFFDNRREAEFLMSEGGQTKIAECLFACIQECEKLKPI